MKIFKWFCVVLWVAFILFAVIPSFTTIWTVNSFKFRNVKEAYMVYGLFIKLTKCSCERASKLVTYKQMLLTMNVYIILKSFIGEATFHKLHPLFTCMSTVTGAQVYSEGGFYFMEHHVLFYIFTLSFGVEQYCGIGCWNYSLWIVRNWV